MDKISSVLALLAGISVAVERVVELIKSSVPALARAWATGDGFRRAIIQLSAVLAGTIVAYQMPSELSAALGSRPSWTVDLLIGLMASGGAGLWNHVLDIVKATKVDRELQVVTPACDKPETPALAAAKA